MSNQNPNHWTNKLGDFQAGVGKFSAGYNYIGSIITGSIFILIGLILIVIAFIPLGSSDGWSCQKNSDCFGDETCDLKRGKCRKKKKRYWWLSLIGILFILLALAGIFFARWYHGWVHENKTNAQIGGAFAEANFISNMFNN